MRHTYATRALILARRPHGEASAALTVLTPDLGLLVAKAQSIRKPCAKLAPALATFTESDVLLVRGNEYWRIAGALLSRQWQRELTVSARVRASRVNALLMRLAPIEIADPGLFPIMSDFLQALTLEEDTLRDAAECLAVLRLLSVLGLDAGPLPSCTSAASAEALQQIAADRTNIIERINKGIAASGL